MFWKCWLNALNRRKQLSVAKVLNLGPLIEKFNTQQQQQQQQQQPVIRVIPFNVYGIL